MAEDVVPPPAPARPARAAWAGGWRALYATWAVLALVVLGGAGWLAWLGPVEAPPPAQAAGEAGGAAPTGTAAALPVPASAPGPEPTGEAAAAAAVPPAMAAAATPVAAPAAVASSGRGAPAAPEPPSLAAAGGGAAAAPAPPGERPIPAPDPELQEPGPHGALPRIGAAGRTAIRAYGRAFPRQDPRPRVGLIVGGLGLNAAVTEEAIRRLPGGVALAFSPYAPQVERLLEQARARGMEALVALPLEPSGYPLNSPGNRALLVGLSDAENSDRLLWALSRFGGYVGAVGAHGPMRGEGFARLPDRLGALQAALAARGLLYVDPRPGAPPPARAWGRAVDLLVDEPATRGEIEIKLAALERLARERGTALGYAGEASPVLVERVAAWGAGLEGRGLALAPVSALIRGPAEPEAAAAARGGAASPRAN